MSRKLELEPSQVPARAFEPSLSLSAPTADAPFTTPSLDQRTERSDFPYAPQAKKAHLRIRTGCTVFHRANSARREMPEKTTENPRRLTTVKTKKRLLNASSAGKNNECMSLSSSHRDDDLTVSARPSGQSLQGRARRLQDRQLGNVVERPGGLNILAETVLVLEHIRPE